jgi:hypothetical protein
MLQHESTLPVPPLLAALRSHTFFAPVKALLRVIAATLYLACAGCVAAPVQRVHPASETSSVATLSDAEDAQIIREVVGEFISAGLYGDEFRDPQNGQNTMPSGFRLQNGQDFDDIFEPRGSTTAGPATGYKTSDGQDLNQRYRVTSGGDLALYNTKYKTSDGNDMRTKFRRRAYQAGINPPTISSITSNSPQTVGQTVTMSVTATGSSLQYQWFKGLNAISGATASSYSFTAAGADDSGMYSCNVWNGGGSLRVSTPVVVTTSATGAPVITNITSNSPQAVGSIVTISVTATGSLPLTYLWYGPRGYIASATSSSYSFVAEDPFQMGTYRCYVVNAAGMDEESTDIVITGTYSPPDITHVWTNAPRYVGERVEMQVFFDSYGLTTIQWFLDDEPITGATSSYHYFDSTSTSESGTYSVVVTNADGSDTSSVEVSVLAQTDPPVITSITSNSPHIVGNLVTMSVTVSGTGPFNYQWSNELSYEIPGATSAEYSFTPDTVDRSGLFSCRVTNAGGSDNESIYISIYPTGTAPVITASSGGGTMDEGNTASFSVTASGSGTLTYSWSGPHGTHSGSSWSFTAYPSDSGTYTCTVSSIYGSDSETFYLTVNAIAYPPVISWCYGGGTIATGETAQFFCSASGDTPLTYTWTGPHGTYVGNNWSFTGAATSDSGTYTCTVTNDAGSDSATVELTVLSELHPSASISGPPLVPSGGGGGGSWSWSVSCHSSTTIYRYRVGIAGHTTNWTYPSPGTTSASGSVAWSSPFGNPDISTSPGSYDLVCEIEDNAGRSASDSAHFTVM